MYIFTTLEFPTQNFEGDDDSVDIVTSLFQYNYPWATRPTPVTEAS